MEFRVGGIERSRFRFEGGPAIVGEAIYQDIVPDTRIVFAYTMTLDGNEQDRPWKCSVVWATRGISRSCLEPPNFWEWPQFWRPFLARCGSGPMPDSRLMSPPPSFHSWQLEHPLGR
jgi:uncharacterized protein YndB with AHSA1/START domain